MPIPFLCAATDEKTIPLTGDNKTAAHCLLLPGDKLHLTPLLAAKKFRKEGNKLGAVRAFQLLQKDGLGKTIEFGRGINKVRTLSNEKYMLILWVTSDMHIIFLFLQQYEFVKAEIPSEANKKAQAQFRKALSKYNVSLLQYSTAFKQQGITP